MIECDIIADIGHYTLRGESKLVKGRRESVNSAAKATIKINGIFRRDI